MARIGISITKSCPFRNSVQEFSNVYFFDGGVALPDQTEAESLIDELVSIEKTFHSTAVTFVRGRLWSQTGDKATSNMIAQKNLSGTGVTSLVSGMDRERAYLVRVRAGSDSRGNPVYLRKWYHSCGGFAGGVLPSVTILDNTSGFSVAQKDAIVNAVDPISEIGAGGNRTICAKSGRNPDLTANWQAHNYLEHHQMGDMWRAQ